MVERDSSFKRQIAFVFDQRYCIGCRSCQLACKDLHDLPVGVNWRRVVARESGKFPKLEVSYLSLSCNHCLQPACLDACPVGAIVKRERDGVVLLDSSLCAGCRSCVEVCPHGAPQCDPATGLVSKCDLCYELVASGEQPACVSACTMRVLRLLDSD